MNGNWDCEQIGDVWRVSCILPWLVCYWLGTPEDGWMEGNEFGLVTNVPAAESMIEKLNSTVAKKRRYLESVEGK